MLPLVQLRPTLESFRHRAAFLLKLGCVLAVAALASDGPEPARSAPSEQSLVLGAELRVRVEAVARVAVDAGACSETGAGCESASRAPLQGARVRAYRALPGDRHRLLADARTDGTGSAVLRASTGTYWLLVDAPSHARHSERVTLERAPLGLVVRLGRAPPFRVTVSDEGGNPVPAARVSVQGGDALPVIANASARGVAELDSVGEVVHSVRVSAPGYEDAVIEPSERDLAVTLRAPLTLEVTVLDANGAPQAGAEVWLAGGHTWPAREVVTGPHGVARVEGLSPGLYDLRAHHGSSVSQALTGISLMGGEPSSVTLELGAGHFVTVQVSQSEAAPPRPVAGAEVSLIEDGLGPFPLRARTGENGAVRLGPMPPGEAMLSVHASGFMSESGVRVNTDEDRRVELALLAVGRLSGRVLDREGRAIDGATLEIIGNDWRGRPIARYSAWARTELGAIDSRSSTGAPLVPLGELGVMPGPLPAPGGAESGSPAPSRAWLSDADGEFRLDEVPPGRLQVLARHPDFVVSTSPGVELPPGGSRELTVVLERGAALEGRLLDERGEPVAHARIDAIAPRANFQVSTFSGSDGYFAFGAVATELELFVARPSNRYRFVARQDLSLRVGERREIELVLPRERPSVVVLVSDAAGEPIARARVSLLSLDAGVPLRITTPTDAAGRVEFEDAEGLRAALEVRADGFRAFSAQLDALPAQSEVRLEQTLAANGRVTVVRGRQGLSGARVVLTQGGERMSVLSGPDGEYRFEDVAPGPVELSISHPEYSTRELSAVITAPSDRVEEFEIDSVDLTEAGAIAGRVVDAEGEPVRGARVALGFVAAFLPAGPVPEGVAETDAEGDFLLQAVPIGRVELSAYAAGLGRGRVEDVVVRAGETTEPVEIQLHGGAQDLTSEGLANLAITLGERERSGQLFVVVVDVARGSEAARAGLLEGDVIVEVDGQPVADMADARELMAGSEGSDVVLDLERKGELLSLRIRREPVRQ